MRTCNGQTVLGMLACGTIERMAGTKCGKKVIHLDFRTDPTKGVPAILVHEKTPRFPLLVVPCEDGEVSDR